MIYTTQGVMQRQYAQLDGDDWQHLLKSVQHPQWLQASNEQIESYKHTNAPYVVYGTSTGLDRGQSEITARSILFIDVDDNGKDYQTEAHHIDAFLNSFTVNHVIYPTISNGIKPSERLRVAIPLDVELDAEAYSQVWQVLTHYMHLNADPAGAQKAFKQLQGLYVYTTQNAHNEPIIEADGKPLDTAFFLSKYENLSRTTSASRRTTGVPTTGNIPKWAMNNRKIINALLDPETHYSDFGGWDNMLTSIGGWVFKSTQGDIELSADVVQATNDRGISPIPFDDLKHKFASWSKHWRY
ncbi:hypothetical protein [Weissella viridescens]|jgi:hypothetical protein|uniref:hypothetical protein n=1 Tax=Weissella viridescens TaxID=1629 RepID=UPI001745FF0F|nr:hypothetical protein [Weissella viridescens]MBX4172089.1 hypothetical protein [Weissella viridescens]QOD85726.1 hypothetical protein IE337_05855 [Weissella viridescens]